ncbi:3-deoxy-7-phosphoheptulonate synthase [Oceanimonas sp. NS1]|nr:3-deoxy-7-phosphoheptulonate synthase [Oceanimonas sp. NS1]
MQKDTLNNIHIQSEKVMITPAELKAKLPISQQALDYIGQARQTISDIVHRKDHRLLVICGPCSIHDIDAAKEYATRLKKLHDEYSDSLYIVMRVYFEKPRTAVGWKGFIGDPHLDGSFDIELGLHKARELLCWLAELELPLASPKRWIPSARTAAG